MPQCRPEAFTDEFYRQTNRCAPATVLDTLKYLCRETDVWVELTTLLIPGLNDTAEESAQ